MEVTAFSLAQRFIGTQEVAGHLNNPHIMAMLRLDASWPESDEVPWCSAFVNYICWLLGLPRSRDLRARSWLGVGREVINESARVDSDVVVLRRGPNPALGHVGFFAGISNNPARVQVLGGNQNNSVYVAWFPLQDVISVRRLTS